LSILGRSSALVFRIGDQLLWSFAFFAFNFAASIVLEAAGYAALAVSSSLSFILIAMVRAWTTNARVIVGAKNGLRPEQSLDRLGSLLISVIAAFAASTLTFAWLSPTESARDTAVLSVLAGVLVLADTPRQVLIYAAQYRRAFGLSVIYAVAAIIGFLMASLGGGEEYLLLAWYAGSIVSFSVGVFLQRNVNRALSSKLRVGAYAWRLSAEALYAGLANQLAILILYSTADPEATAGYRLAYGLVFAPAFMVIQGLAPLYNSKLARGHLERTNRMASTTLYWSAMVMGLVVLCAAAATFGAAIFPGYQNLASAVPYLLPVGLSLLGSQLLEATIQTIRFTRTPVYTHRLRLFVIGIDLAVQALAVGLGGVGALVTSVAIIGVIKSVASVGFSLRLFLRRKNTG
jgi:hypothetical protein